MAGAVEPDGRAPERRLGRAVGRGDACDPQAVRDCGPGIDRAKVDGIDRIKNCERLIAVKRRGPVKH